MLAKRLASSSGKRYAPEVLERARATPSQGTMPSAKARRRNVLGAFRVPVDRRVELRGKAVVLIDDVFTTGATLNACARALHRAGAKNVSALTLARVVRPAPGAI
jgi:predicted amidophosphoribosyltransferase